MAYECCWCPANRFRTRTELNDHEHEHAMAERVMRLRECRPAASVTAERFEAAVAQGLQTEEECDHGL